MTSTHKVLAVLAGILGGYLLGFIVMETFDAVGTTRLSH